MSTRVITPSSTASISHQTDIILLADKFRFTSPGRVVPLRSTPKDASGIGIPTGSVDRSPFSQTGTNTEVSSASMDSRVTDAPCSITKAILTCWQGTSWLVNRSMIHATNHGDARSKHSTGIALLGQDSPRMVRLVRLVRLMHGEDDGRGGALYSSWAGQPSIMKIMCHQAVNDQGLYSTEY